MDGFKTLRTGQAVEFQVKEDDGKSLAADVRVVEWAVCHNYEDNKMEETKSGDWFLAGFLFGS